MLKLYVDFISQGAEIETFNIGTFYVYIDTMWGNYDIIEYLAAVLDSEYLLTLSLCK